MNVLKLIVKGTVEEHILRCAETKLKLDERIRGCEEDELEEEVEQVDDTVMNALKLDMNV